MHPFVSLIRRYCIDYMNSHDQSLVDEVFDPTYVLHIQGHELVRSSSHFETVRSFFDMAPGVGLLVHELVLDGDHLCMHFSEHASLPTGVGTERSLACWRGIGLYDWNGERLTSTFVEEDYSAMTQQLASGEPHPLLPPHIDPWMTTEPAAGDPDAEDVVRGWLARGDLTAAPRWEIDDSRVDREYRVPIEADGVIVNRLFSAGDAVPFHATCSGSYAGGLGDAASAHLGEPATLHVAGIARVADGDVVAVTAVTSRLQMVSDLTGVQLSL